MAVDGQTMNFVEVLRDYIRKFNSGKFRDAALQPELKEAWVKLHSPLCRGLMILASVYLHIENGNAPGARIKMQRALAQFEQLPPTYLGFDIESIRQTLRACLACVSDDLSPEELRRRVPAFTLAQDVGKILGTEPELTFQ